MKTDTYSELEEAGYGSANELMNQRISPSAGETFWVVGHRVTILPAGPGYSYVDVFSPAHTPGPPPHRHTDCSELFHVLEGRVEFTVGEEQVLGGPGECLLVPRNTLHTFRPVADSGSRVITVFAPGGFDRWFRAMGVPVDAPNGRERSVGPELLQRIQRESIRYHMEIVAGH